MSFQWLHLRIQEEKDRREREKLTLERLPIALEDLHDILKQGVESYKEAFGPGTVEIVLLPSKIKITARESKNDHAQPLAKVEVVLAGEIPGFRVDRGDKSVDVEVGILSSNNLFYRDRERDVYLNMEDLTRRILDPVLFPKLGD
ncbi:MAG TPA: hypothetical protein VNV86_18995 [Candidatus Acidoferrum sp.]|jgi:hypothetical protein|nr:hypothetical protein [Candidatus Acidoferrum sp.]